MTFASLATCRPGHNRMTLQRGRIILGGLTMTSSQNHTPRMPSGAVHMGVSVPAGFSGPDASRIGVKGQFQRSNCRQQTGVMSGFLPSSHQSCEERWEKLQSEAAFFSSIPSAQQCPIGAQQCPISDPSVHHH